MEKRKKITLEEFLNTKEKTCIHCETEEKGKTLCKALDKMIINKRYSYVNFYYSFAYRYDVCFCNDNTFKAIDIAKSEGYKIYEFKDIILPKDPLQIFKVGDRVQIKPWKEMKKVFGIEDSDDDFLTRWLKPICGKYATIISVDKSCRIESYEIELFDLTHETCILPEMLKPQTRKFTEDEEVILKNLPAKYNYIARDSDGELYVYSNKPTYDGTFKRWNKSDNCDCVDLSVYAPLFYSIKCENKEPCEFRKFI